jgi:ParB family chromosome partitioning protein
MANKTALGNILDQINTLPTLGKNNTLPEANIDNTAVDIPLEEKLISIDPQRISNWEFHDRPEKELGDLALFAKELKDIGQQQPCIVRPSTKTSSDYELVVGERRWRAALLANLPLWVIVKKLNDSDAAMVQAVENDSRIDLSDYAKGMSFSKLIDKGVIKQKDLIQKLGKSKQYVSALLSFSKIPQPLVDAIKDFTKVNAYTAEKIKQLANKDAAHLEALISLSPKIRDGLLRSNKAIESAVSNLLLKKEVAIVHNEKIFTKDGRHVFTWRKDNNGIPAIHFPKHVHKLFTDGKLNLKEISDDLLKILDEKFEVLKKSGIPDW